MKSLPQLRNFTKGKFLIAVFIASAAVGSDLVENTFETGTNLFTTVPASILVAGAA